MWFPVSYTNVGAGAGHASCGLEVSVSVCLSFFSTFVTFTAHMP